MQFKDDFYTIEASTHDEDTLVYSIVINKDHDIFNGEPSCVVTKSIILISESEPAEASAPFEPES